MTNETTLRLQFNPEKIKRLNEQVEACGLDNHAQLFNEMIEFFFTAIAGIEKGAQPALYTPNEERVDIITTPGLKKAIDNYLKTHKIKTPQKPQLSLVVDNNFKE